MDKSNGFAVEITHRTVIIEYFAPGSADMFRCIGNVINPEAQMMQAPTRVLFKESSKRRV